MTLVLEAPAQRGDNRRAAARLTGVTYDQFGHCYRKYDLRN